MNQEKSMGIESERAPFDNSGPPYTLDGMDPVLRDLIVCAVHGAMAMEKPPREGHWLMSSWQLGRAALPAQPDRDGDTATDWNDGLCQNCRVPLREPAEFRDMPNPTAFDLVDPLFNAIWNVTKAWDVNAPEYYQGYCGLNGSHVMIILAAVRRALLCAPATTGVTGRPQSSAEAPETLEDVARSAVNEAMAAEIAALREPAPVAWLPDHAAWEAREALRASRPKMSVQPPWRQPDWSHIGQAFLDGAREARANPEADDRIFMRTADAYTKRVHEEVDPATAAWLLNEAWKMDEAIDFGDAAQQSSVAAAPKARHR